MSKKEFPWKGILVGLLSAIVFLLIVVLINQRTMLQTNTFQTTYPEEVAEVEVPIETVAVEEVVEELTPEVMDSPDLKWLRLEGRVKSVTETISYTGDSYKESKTYNFDEAGNYVPGGKQTVTRNDAGQIVKMKKTTRSDGYTYTEVYTYKYNDAGYVNYESYDMKGGDGQGEKRTHSLNDKGWIVSTSVNGYEEIFKYTGKVTYNYSNIDGNGNWLKAVVKESRRTTEFGEPIGNDTYDYVITRKISYWN